MPIFPRSSVAFFFTQAREPAVSGGGETFDRERNDRIPWSGKLPCVAFVPLVATCILGIFCAVLQPIGCRRLYMCIL